MLDPFHLIRIGGKDYKITPPTLGTEDLFTDYLKKFAAQEVARLRESYGPAFPEALKAVTQDVASGSYDWLSDGFWRAVMTDRHLQKLSELVLNQEANGAVTLDMVRRHWRESDGDTIVKDGQIVPVTKGQLLAAKIVEYILRPNVQGPAQQPGSEASQSQHGNLSAG